MTKEERRAFLKCAEELSELSVELLQSVNKEREVGNKRILKEIKDVEQWLRRVRKINEG
jgi:hypothetical protein